MVVAAELEDFAVHELDGHRLVAQGGEVGAVAVGQGMAVGAEHHLFGWREGVEGDLDGGDEAEGALAAADQFAEVDIVGLGGAAGEDAEVGVECLVDGVAAAAAAQGGVGEVVGDKAADVGVGLPGFELGVYLVEQGASLARGGGEGGAVGKEAADFEHMVAGAAVDERVGAAGVVAHHAADAAAVAGGGLGAEEEAVGFEG